MACNYGPLFTFANFRHGSTRVKEGGDCEKPLVIPYPPFAHTSHSAKKVYHTLIKIKNFVENSLEDTFLKILPTAAALSLPCTNFLPSAPALKVCPISPLRNNY